MTIRKLLAVISLALLASCGSTDNATFTISTGAYAVSNGTATDADGCNMAQVFIDPTPNTNPDDDPFPIYITVTDEQAVVNMIYDPDFPNETPPADSLVTTSIDGNAITNTTAGDFTKNVEGTSCTYRQQMTINGDITANDEVALTVVYTKSEGSNCTLIDLGISETSTDPFDHCTSTVHFLGKKQ